MLKSGLSAARPVSPSSSSTPRPRSTAAVAPTLAISLSYWSLYSGGSMSDTALAISRLCTTSSNVRVER